MVFCSALFQRTLPAISAEEVRFSRAAHLQCSVTQFFNSSTFSCCSHTCKMHQRISPKNELIDVLYEDQVQDVKMDTKTDANSGG